MPDAIYDDLQLAAIYETLNPPGQDEEYYLALAGTTPLRILDMGCGTGRLAADLATLEHHVTGADPAKGMLQVARTRPRSDTVTWVQSDAATLSLRSRFDLIIMTGHAFQILRTDDAVVNSLVNLRRHLADGGRLAFETRNPLAREWEEWTPGNSTETLDIPSIGRIEVFSSIASAELPFVTYMTHFHFANGERRTEPATLRFMEKSELAAFLSRCGFCDVAWYGNWDRSAWTPESPEIIVVAS